ncbi:MAG: Imidazole glycerol phosphate synthase subunit HisH [Verrucomicrobia subdivision 3 bacterium]|nr:Imidazole glycerol phosphate synthase subunit HisH [Limisphaerales bacterium]MCS1413960.1 Imidazole glycerol phosphate synthase subunit HisH [Limisphaerales bacterium]
MIALVDYGSGNIRSVHKALIAVEAEVKLVRGPEDFQEDYQGMVLPGVGAFDDCVSALQGQELWPAVLGHIGSGKLFLGICVGYQALFEASNEFNSCATGLKVFKGKVVRFPDDGTLKVPQIGWNQLDIVQPGCPLFDGVPNHSYAYFVHSFHPEPIDKGIVSSWTNYGRRFASAVWRDNVFATQFHPEKSQAVGLRMLRNFVGLV